jgi:CBS domain-containing protein
MGEHSAGQARSAAATHQRFRVRSAMPQRPIRSIIAKQKILTTTAEISVAEAARLMKKKSVGAVMVVKDNGRLAGIFTERDAVFRVLAEGRDPKTTRLSDVMTPHPQTIAPEKPFGHALMMMYESGFRHVPVVEDGKPVGMVSARDALGPEMLEFESELQRRTRIGEILG